MKRVGIRRIVFSLFNRKLSLTWVLQLVLLERMPMVLFKILSWVLKEWFKLQSWWETHFSFWLHTLSIISFLLLSFYIFITNITRKPETWSTFLDHTLSSVQLLSHVQLFVTPWNAALQTSLPISNSQSLLNFMSIKSVMPSNHLIFCHPIFLLPSIFPNIRVFSNESDLLIRWSKYWSFSFNISPSNEYSGLISFRIDWLDLLAIQGTLKSLLQHHSSEASIL